MATLGDYFCVLPKGVIIQMVMLVKLILVIIYFPQIIETRVVDNINQLIIEIKKKNSPSYFLYSQSYLYFGKLHNKTVPMCDAKNPEPWQHVYTQLSCETPLGLSQLKRLWRALTLVSLFSLLNLSYSYFSFSSSRPPIQFKNILNLFILHFQKEFHNQDNYFYESTVNCIWMIPLTVVFMNQD